MYELHTTRAYILRAYPHGESNRVYTLFTREKGLLYAHGQGVREVKSRNRYALKTGTVSNITLVKGREWWRITGAAEIVDDELPKERGVYMRKVLSLVPALVPIEDPLPYVFDVLEECKKALSLYSSERARFIELITVARLLDVLGYLERPFTEPIFLTLLDGKIGIQESLLDAVQKEERILLHRVNNALTEAR